MVDLLVDHARGDVAGHVGCCHLHGGRLKRALVLLRTGLREAGTDVIFQRVQRIELGNVLCELVVELGLDGLLDLVHLALEDGGLACKLLGAVVLGERDVHIALLTGDCADQRIFKAGDERAGAEREGVVLCLAALEGLIVHKALEVDDDGVAVGCCAVDGLDARVALCHTIHFRVNFALFDLHLALGHLKALVLAEDDLGIDGDLKGVDELLVVVDLLIEQAGRADALKAALGTAGLKSLLRQRLDGFGIEHVLAVHALDDGARRLALAEAGHVEMVLILFICFVDRIVKDIGRDLHFKGRHVFFFLFDVLDVHWVSSSNHLSPGALFT